jgi:hypothetical protein
MLSYRFRACRARVATQSLSRARARIAAAFAWQRALIMQVTIARYRLLARTRLQIFIFLFG